MSEAYKEKNLFLDLREARILLERLGKDKLAVAIEVAAAKLALADNPRDTPEKR